MKSKKILILKIAIAVFTFGIGITTLFSVKVNADSLNIIELGTIINPHDIIIMPDVNGDSKEYGTSEGMFRYSMSKAGGFYYDGNDGWSDYWVKDETSLTYVGSQPITITSIADESDIDLLLQPYTPSETNGIYEGTRELTQKLIFGDNELTTWQEGVLDTISILVTIFVYLLPFILFFAVVKILLKP